MDRKVFQMIASDACTGSETMMYIARAINDDKDMKDGKKELLLSRVQNGIDALNISTKRATIAMKSGPWVAKDFNEDAGSFFSNAERKEIRDIEKRNKDSFKERESVRLLLMTEEEDPTVHQATVKDLLTVVKGRTPLLS